MKLISGRQKQATHVDRQQIGAVPTSHSHSFEQARTRNTDLKINTFPAKPIKEIRSNKLGWAINLQNSQIYHENKPNKRNPRWKKHKKERNIDEIRGKEKGLWGKEKGKREEWEN